MRDDAFAYFAKEHQDFYVVRTRQLQGCGLPGCEASVSLVPFDEWQDYV